MGKTLKKFGKVNCGNKSIKFDVNVFGGGGHTDYSGYGAHAKDRRADRRARKQEEKNAKRGEWGY